MFCVNMSCVVSMYLSVIDVFGCWIIKINGEESVNCSGKDWKKRQDIITNLHVYTQLKYLTHN